jgi:hypothetical protein
VLSCGREVTGGHDRRSRAASAAGALAPANRRLGLANKRREELRWCKRKGAVHSRGTVLARRRSSLCGRQWRPAAALDTGALRAAGELRLF